MAELPLEMPNLLNFPMDKLCYDLVLEVIEALEPKDVPALMKVDRRFRWILLQKPARIFGKQIHLIRVEMGRVESLDDEGGCYGCEDIVFIMKFAESTPLPFYDSTHEVLLLSQVERCSFLNISENGYGCIDALLALKKAFANLKQVDDLEVNGNLNDCLWNLKAEVTNRASLRFFDLRKEIHQQLLLFLINGSLQNCKMISMDLYSDPDFYPTVYSALSKTQLELFVTKVAYFDNPKLTIELILNSGIPSGNKEAACIVQVEMAVEIRNLIKNFPEIRQVNEPNKTFIRDAVMETIEVYVYLDGPFDCYLKRIDKKRDCIHVVGPHFFFAKYVSSIQF